MENQLIDVAVFKHGARKFRVRAFLPANSWNECGRVLEERLHATPDAANREARAMAKRLNGSISKLA
jgi:hypothetical protein